MIRYRGRRGKNLIIQIYNLSCCIFSIQITLICTEKIRKTTLHYIIVKVNVQACFIDFFIAIIIFTTFIDIVEILQIVLHIILVIFH